MHNAGRLKWGQGLQAAVRTSSHLLLRCVTSYYYRAHVCITFHWNACPLFVRLWYCIILPRFPSPPLCPTHESMCLGQFCNDVNCALANESTSTESYTHKHKRARPNLSLAYIAEQDSPNVYHEWTMNIHSYANAAHCSFLNYVLCNKFSWVLRKETFFYKTFDQFSIFRRKRISRWLHQLLNKVICGNLIFFKNLTIHKLKMLFLKLAKLHADRRTSLRRLQHHQQRLQPRQRINKAPQMWV